MTKQTYRDMNFEQCVSALMRISRQGMLSATKHYKYVGDATTVSKLEDAIIVANNRQKIIKLEAQNNEITDKYSI